MSFTPVLLALGLALNLNAFAGAGSSNGGDGVIINGKLVPRDFLSSSEVVLDNKQFLESVPEFISLLKELAEVHPLLATHVWSDLMRTRIWTTEQSLQLLPSGQTGLTEQAADAQIAIRSGSDIIISMPAFSKTEREYILLHESLHGLLDGSGPFHHEKVRSLVKLFKNQRGSYSRATLNQAFSKVGLQVNSYTTRDMANLEEEILRTLLLEQGSFEVRCAIRSIGRSDSLTFGPWLAEAMGRMQSWSAYDKCSDGEEYAIFAKMYPALDQYRKTAYGSVLPTYRVNPSKDRDLKKIHIEQCRSYGSAKEEARVQEIGSLLSAAQAELQAMERSSADLDPATRLYLRIMRDYQPGDLDYRLGGYLRFKNIEGYLSQNREAASNQAENARVCRQLFGDKIFK